MPAAPSIETLLPKGRFASLHRDWLPLREQRLSARLRARKIEGPKNILLVNATLGLTFYPSIVDFFATLQRVHPEVRITSASYFDDQVDLAQDVARRGIPVVSIATVRSWDAAALSRFDWILAVGPSETLAWLMNIDGLKPRLAMLDLGFYHQMIDATRGAFTQGHGGNWGFPPSDQKNDVACYSCQPEEKVTQDLGAHFALDRFRWTWLAYIPIGFTYREYFRSDAKSFDVALLGTDGRDYELLEPELLGGLRILFMGSTDRAPYLERLRSRLDMTVVSRVNEDDYARLLASCRCVVLPMLERRDNVLLSVIDALASGVPIVTSRRAGLRLLERQGAPLVFCADRWKQRQWPDLGRVVASCHLAATIGNLLRDEPRRRDLSERSIEFARQHLDIYGMLEALIDAELPAERK